MTHAVRHRFVFVAALCALVTWTGIAQVSADTASSGRDLAVAQSLGGRELTIVLRRVTSAPGPLRVDVVSHEGSPGGRLTLDVTPTGTTARSSTSPAPGAPTARGVVGLGSAPGMYSATVTVDRPGPWELAVGDGQRVARIPFEVPVQATSPPERLVYGGFLAAGTLLVASVVVAARARRSGWALLPAGGVLVGLSVAVTAAVLSASLPLPPQPGGQLDPTVDNVTDPYALSQPLISDFSRPPVTLALNGDPVTAGRPGELGLDLSDGATGAPVDDLLVHDSALIHLLVAGPGGRLWHLHPIRIAPGRYQVQVTLPEPGRYALSAEMVRRGGGVQLVRAAGGLHVLPGASPQPRTIDRPVRLGKGRTTVSTVIDATPINVMATDPMAGTPTTVAAKVGDTADLQPWLNMVGHMIVAGPLRPGAGLGEAVQNAPVWAHAHSMGGAMSMPDMPDMGMPGMSGGGMTGMAPSNGDSAPDETVAAYGPDVPFTYTFPIAGQYRLWIQVERHYKVLTVPVLIEVAGSAQGTQR
ncbi:MAG: hypothetical protein JWP48_653 [Actinoallomurus sp.]|nr:hypothetical protein [Actinoallomurus sp.]